MAGDTLPPGPEKVRVFISYSRADSAYAERVLSALEGAGYEAYLDRHDIAPGEPWEERLDGLILDADAVVFVISPSSIASKVCGWEVDRTVSYTKRLVPLVHRRVDGDIPANLSRLNWIFGDASDDLDAGVIAALRAAIDTDIAWERERTLWIARAERWHRNGRSEGAVLRSGEIEAATSWLLRKPANAEPLPEVVDGLLHASREKEDRDRRRTRRMQLAVGALLVLAAVVLVIGAASVLRIAQQQSERSAHVLSRLSERAYEAGDYDLAVRYAVAGLNGHDAFLLGFDPRRLEANLAAAIAENRLMALWHCHDRPIRAVAISDDDARLASTGEDGTVCVWDTATGRRLFKFEMENSDIIDFAAFSPDATLLLASNGIGITVWDLGSGRAQASIRPDDHVRDAAFSRDGRLIAVAASDPDLHLYDAATGALANTFRGHSSGLVDVEFSPDGARLLTASASLVTQSGGSDATVRVWDVASGRQLSVMSHDEGLNEAHFSPDGERIVSGGSDLVRLWNSRTGAQIGTMPGYAGAFSPSGRTVMSNGDDAVHYYYGPDSWNMNRLWRRARWGANDMQLGIPIDQRSVVVRSAGAYDLAFWPQSEVADALFSHDGERLYVGASDGAIRVWSVSPVRRQEPSSRAPGFISYAAPLPGGTRALAWEGGGTLALVNLEREADPVRMQGGPLGRGWPYLSSDGTRVTWTSAEGGRARVWNAQDGRLLANLELEGMGAPNNPTLAANGALVLGAAPAAGRVWDVESGRVLLETNGERERLLAGGLSPNGRLIVTGSNDSVIVSELGSRRRIATMDVNERVLSVQFNPDGDRLVIHTTSGAQGWTVGEHPRSFLRVEQTNLAFSPDGTKLYALAHGRLTVWEADGRELFAHPDASLAAWSQDGRYVAVKGAGSDPTVPIVVFDADNGVRMWTLQADFMARPAFGANGRSLMFIEDASVTTWDISRVVRRNASDLVASVCNVMLDSDERRRFTAEQLTRAPVLDPTHDRDPCAMPSPWERLASTLIPR